MSDPLPLAFLVTGALALLGLAVTLMLWRTVHGRHQSEDGGNPRIAELLEDLLGESPVRQSTDSPCSTAEAQKRFQQFQKDGKEKQANRAACALVALGGAQDEHLEYLRDHRGPVDSHRWKRLSERLLRQNVFSPRQDPSIDALAALIGTALKLPPAPPLAHHGLKPSSRCVTPDEGPEVVLTLSRSALALGLDLPAVYVDEKSASALDILPYTSRMGAQLLVRVGREAAGLTSTGQRSFLCGATLCRLHHSLLITKQAQSATQLHHLFVETRLFVDESSPEADVDIPSTSGLLSASTLSRLTPPLLDVVRERGGWPDEREILDWWRATRETCLRVGLVLAGDIREAASVLETVGSLGATEPSQPGAALEELSGFLLSDDYDKARRHLLGNS